MSNAISVGDNSSVALTNSVGIGNNLPESWFLPGVALNNKFFVRPAGVSFNSMTSGLLNLHNYNKQVPVQLLVGQNNLIAYSSDNNNSWFIIPTDFTDTNDFNLVKCGLDASNNGVCVAVSKANNTHPARIYYTHDAITWTEATLNVTLTNNVNMNDLNFITDTSNTNYFILAGDNGNLLYSKDGVHWQKLNDDSINNMNLSSSSFAKINNKDLLIMSGNDSNAKSYMVSCEITSTGLFCKSSLPLDDTLINKTFVNTMANKTRLFVIGSKTTNNITTPLVKYSDNGDSWQDANIVNSSGLGHVSSITASAQNILISIDSGSSSVVYSSSNGDVFNKNALSIIPDDNFTLALNKNSSIEYISSLGKFIFLTSNNGVFLTNDANPLPEKKWTRYLTNNTGVAPVFLSKNLIY